MASVSVDPSSVKSSRCSNPSRKVRLLGKINGGDSESLSQNSNSWITVKNPEGNGSSEKCRVFFESQSTRYSRKDGYELDYCYGQHDEIDRIYSREIQPIILESFDGRNASIIALGARGCGKTYTIQGSQEKPGIAVIAMSEILSKAKEFRKSVSVSLYELTREHVKDLLNPDHPAIQVLEGAQGKINIKGLSQVGVKSISEFHDIYFTKGGSRTAQKSVMDQPHKGLMVHISSDDDTIKGTLPVKINFVDLAGYQDLRRNSKDGITPAESNRKNKSLYALLNVVSAINANDTRVPYRESILTRILQDSLGGRSHVLLLTCLNPSFCEDSLSTISLVSRTYRSTKQVFADSTNRKESLAKSKELSSLKNVKPVAASLSVKKELSSLKNGKPVAAKKQIDSRLPSTKKASSILKGRKLFDEVKKVNSKQLRCQSEDTSVQKSKTTPPSLEAPQDTSVAECCSSLEVEQTQDVILEEHVENALDLEQGTTTIKTDVKIWDSQDVSPHSETHNAGVISASTCAENNLFHMKDNGSPPLSLKIKELCNSLKQLYESTPSIIKPPEDTVVPFDSQVDCNNILEPKTPVMESKIIKLPEDTVVPFASQVDCRNILEPKTPVMESKIVYHSPRGATFSNRSSRMKDSLVKECLNFLNSANKEELKSLRHIGEKRATKILEFREESPEPFKTLDDLQDIGICISGKKIKDMMRQVAGID